MFKGRKIQTGTCLWCGQEKECIEVEFDDGSFKGLLCKTDFWRLAKTRSNGRAKPETVKK